MSTVGGAVTASTYLGDYPRYTTQSIRYAAAAMLLVAISRSRLGRSLTRPVGSEWLWLIAGATAGLSLYNLAVVGALDHAEPTVVATVVSGVPLVLAIAVPLLTRRRVPLALLGAAGLVVVGAIIVQGGGHADLIGLLLSFVALAGEAGFTLLSVPVLDRLGAFSIATHTTWIAALQLGVLAVVTDGSHALPRPDIAVVAATAYLVGASALAFTLWFLAVAEIGAEVAGLAAGIIPIAAVVTGVPLGVASLDARAIAGTALVSIGVVAGMRAARAN
jgi:drug/metabolite transporter (DMT)-like permease